MALASSSAVSLALIKESTFGVIPTTGTPTYIRATGETLDFTISKESSKEINKNRTISSMVPVDASATGNLSIEPHYKGIDPLLESVMQSAYVVFGTNGVGIATSVDCTATTITAAVAPTGSSAFTVLQPGQWFRVVSAGANNGKILRVSTAVQPTSTVLTLDTNTPAAVSTGESIQIQSSRLTHGTTQTSWTIERENSDIGVYMAYTGMTPSKLSWNIASGSLSGLTFDFMGKSAEGDTTSLLPAAPSAPPSYDIHSGVAGATTAVWMDGAPVTGTFVKSVTLDFDNALRSQGAIGTLGAVSLGSGTINCTLSVQVYFADLALFNKYKANTNTSFVFSSTDNDGNGYIISIPKANLSTFKTNAGSKDQDMMLDLTVTALEDASNADVDLRKVVFIDRIGLAVL